MKRNECSAVPLFFYSIHIGSEMYFSFTHNEQFCIHLKINSMFVLKHHNNNNMTCSNNTCLCVHFTWIDIRNYVSVWHRIYSISSLNINSMWTQFRLKRWLFTGPAALQLHFSVLLNVLFNPPFHVPSLGPSESHGRRELEGSISGWHGVSETERSPEELETEERTNEKGAGGVLTTVKMKARQTGRKAGRRKSERASERERRV